MTYTVSCKEDLQIAGCDYVAEGETPGEVLEALVPHLRDEHDLNLPETEELLEGHVGDDWLTGDVDDATLIVVRRLWEELDITPRDGRLEDMPSIGRTTN